MSPNNLSFLPPAAQREQQLRQQQLQYQSLLSSSPSSPSPYSSGSTGGANAVSSQNTLRGSNAGNGGPKMGKLQTSGSVQPSPRPLQSTIPQRTPSVGFHSSLSMPPSSPGFSTAPNLNLSTFPPSSQQQQRPSPHPATSSTHPPSQGQ